MQSPKDVTAPAVASNKPVDLTRTFLQSNLSQLTTAKPVNPNTRPGLSATVHTFNVNPAMPNSTISFQTTNSYRPSGMENANQWDNSNNSYLNNKWMKQSSSNSLNTRQDWSAFESLLPEQSQGNGNNNDVKKLNSNEMMDFLS